MHIILITNLFLKIALLTHLINTVKFTHQMHIISQWIAILFKKYIYIYTKALIQRWFFTSPKVLLCLVTCLRSCQKGELSDSNAINFKRWEACTTGTVSELFPFIWWSFTACGGVCGYRERRPHVHGAPALGTEGVSSPLPVRNPESRFCQMELSWALKGTDVLLTSSCLEYH